MSLLGQYPSGKIMNYKNLKMLSKSQTLHVIYLNIKVKVNLLVRRLKILLLRQ